MRLRRPWPPSSTHHNKVVNACHVSGQPLPPHFAKQGKPGHSVNLLPPSLSKLRGCGRLASLRLGCTGTTGAAAARWTSTAPAPQQVPRPGACGIRSGASEDLMEGPLAATPGHPCSGVPEEAGTSGGEWTSASTRHMAAVRHQQLLQVMVHQAACAASHADKAGVVHKNMWWSSYRQTCAAWLWAAAEACCSDAKLPGFSPCPASGPDQALLASSLACRAVMVSRGAAVCAR